MIGYPARCDCGRARPSGSRTQGAAFAGGKGKPEDAETRRAGCGIQAWLAEEPII